MNSSKNKQSVNSLIEKFNFVDFFLFIKKKVFSFTLLFIFLNIFAFATLQLKEKNFENKIKYLYEIQLSTLLIQDLIQNDYKFTRLYDPIIEKFPNINSLISKFDKNYALDCISKKIIGNNNFQNLKITQDNKYIISINFQNHILDEQILDIIIKDCNLNLLKDFRLIYNESLITFIDDINFEINLQKEEFSNSLDAIEDLSNNYSPKYFSAEFENDILKKQLFNREFQHTLQHKKNIYKLQKYIIELKNLNQYLKIDTLSNSISLKKLHVTQLLPGYNPSAYQIFLFFNILLISIFVILFMYKLKKDD
jgi:hypothetical protein